MGLVSFIGTAVSGAGSTVASGVTYNWSVMDPVLGDLDIGYVSTDAPGVGAGTGLNNITTSILPRPIFQPALGQIVRAWEPSLGYGEFIYLAIPTSTAIPLGTLVSWSTVSGQGINPYFAISVPAKATSQKTGCAVAVCVASTSYNSGAGITSNASSIQYAWFQLVGVARVLKTAVAVPPINAAVASAGVYMSATAGRVYLTLSAGGQILGARVANATTVTSTASTVPLYMGRAAALEGA